MTDCVPAILQWEPYVYYDTLRWVDSPGSCFDQYFFQQGPDGVRGRHITNMRSVGQFYWPRYVHVEGVAVQFSSAVSIWRCALSLRIGEHTRRTIPISQMRPTRPLRWEYDFVEDVIGCPKRKPLPVGKDFRSEELRRTLSVPDFPLMIPPVQNFTVVLHGYPGLDVETRMELHVQHLTEYA